MKEGKSYSLWQLLCREDSQSVLIPQIQRDYIQYRSGKVEKNLKRFVSTLVSSLVNNKPVNLNFVYGNVGWSFDSDNRSTFPAFNPIDGQQRLTTLYLLHYYVFNAADRDDLTEMLKGKLIYRTRKTTEAFLRTLLCENKKKFASLPKSPSGVLRESGWFLSLWESDPSVLSCLATLDRIYEALCQAEVDYEVLAKRLISETGCPISFMKLELDGLDKPNELYIKMNSRGKQLTAFENFKAELYGYISEKNYKDDFKECMDGDWLDLIFEMCKIDDNPGKSGKSSKKLNAEKYTDVFYRDLLHTCFLNSIVAKLKGTDTDYLRDCFGRDGSSYYLEDYKYLEGTPGNSEGDEKYESSMDDRIREVIEEFYYTFKLIHKISRDDKDTFADLSDKLFGISIVKGSPSSSLVKYLENYIPHTLLYAVCLFANSKGAREDIDKKDSTLVEKFSTWWRIAKNLINNSEIDDIASFISSVGALSKFEYSYNVADNADQLTSINLPSLKTEQKNEEVLKQKIINYNQPGWKAAIIDAEGNPVFEGEIFFALKLSGVYTAENAKSDTLVKFKKNWDKIADIFTPENNVLLHRALLTYGDYSTEFTSNGGGSNKIMNYYSFSEKHHNLDWRGMLRHDKGEGFRLFGEMLSGYLDCGCGFAEFAKKRIEDYHENKTSKAEELRYHLIKNEELFDYMAPHYRCWVMNGDYHLLRTSNRSAHKCLRLYLVYLKMKGITMQEGSGYGKPSSITYKKKDYRYEDGKFVSSTGEVVGETVDEMVKYLENL